MSSNYLTTLMIDVSTGSVYTVQGLITLTLGSIPNGSIAGAKLNISGTPTGSKLLRDDFTWVSIAGGGDALVANPLSQFAATTSAQLRGVLSDETGTGAAVFATSPTLVTPALGTPSSGFLTSCTGYEGSALKSTGEAGGVKFLREDGDGTCSWQTVGAGVGDALVANPLSQFAATTSAQLRGVISDETGTGAAVFATSPTLVTPILGTPTSGTLSNCTGYESTLLASTGEAGGTKFLREDGDGTCSWQTISGGGDALVANPLSQFAATTSAQLRSVLSDETGSGAAVFATSPTLVTPALGTPSSGFLTSCTGYEGTAVKSTGQAGGVKYLRENGDGTCSWQTPAGAGDALVGSPLSQFAATTSSQLAGVISDETGSGALVFATSPTLVTPALGTPSSGFLTNCTGYPGTSAIVTVGTITTGVWNGTDIAVADGGTGRSTGTTAYALVATGTTATGAQQTLAAGATTEILVGGGASALPVWTTATGSGAPVRATSPTLVTPVLGVAAATTINKVTLTAPATGSTLTIADGASLITAGAYAVTLTATGATGVTLPTTGTLSTLAGAETLTNKRVTRRVYSSTTATSYAVNSDSYDGVTFTALTTAFDLSNPTGTPTAQQTLIVNLKDNGTTRALTYGSAFAEAGKTLPTDTVAGKWLYLGFMWNPTASKWHLIAISQEV